EKPEEVKGHIVFDHVVFGYNPSEPVLKDISFEVKQGKKVALVGATGAGKSSIINLIPRFYDIQEGSITIDGLDIKEWELSYLRKEVSIVLQDVFLFSDS